jgi:glucosamine--fructose-6-phosphate aminotransferase (isomerizing)
MQRVHYAVDYVITIHRAHPVRTSVPLQLLAYYIAALRGTNVDQSRNLAKSVTVE